ncbi:hypothetical protein U9M48_016906 [Paspalum notatum var. saurae]|uniref:Uncharacterized protein n=1 Tax=Paspalum notatum var. saurae TaxID=547442 RepID=A0AAQ3T6I8_PASNO
MTLASRSPLTRPQPDTTQANHRFSSPPDRKRKGKQLAAAARRESAKSQQLATQMEGLIPFIYRAIKERRSRSYSRCSSTGSAHGRFGGARVEDSAWDKQWEAAAGRETAAHRRHRSLEELAGEVGRGSPEWHHLPKGRSARIFSCISGM